MPKKNSKQIPNDLFNSIIRNNFQLDPEGLIISVEICWRVDNPEGFDKTKEIFDRLIVSHPKAKEIQKKNFFSADFSLHLESTFSRKTIPNVPEDFLEYYPLCSAEEIGRIRLPTNAADKLLQLRADAILENPRIKRVFSKRRETAKGDWSLSENFDNTAFSEYISKLPKIYRKKCRRIPAGFTYTREPNGVCMQTDFGKVILISESLTHYAFFMNLYVAFQDEIPPKDALNSLFIAVRTMFLTESPDFELDPRGDLPEIINNSCKFLVREQIQFVIGHEYGHALLNHLKESNTTTSKPGYLGVLSNNSTKYYTPRQQQEFDADTASLLQINLSNRELSYRLAAATWFFLGLDLLYAISGYINPTINSKNTHPEPIDRIWNLRKVVMSLRAVDLTIVATDKQLQESIDSFKAMKDSIIKDIIPYEVEKLESYGSIYLPSFRKKEIYDRFDY